MDKKKKLILGIAGLLEAVVIVFAFVVSILVITTYHSPEQYSDYLALNLEENGPMIGWLQNNPTPFFLLIVMPILVILALDIVYLVYFALKRESKLSDKERDAIAAKAKEEARLEVLKELEEENREAQ